MERRKRRGGAAAAAMQRLDKEQAVSIRFARGACVDVLLFVECHAIDFPPDERLDEYATTSHDRCV